MARALVGSFLLEQNIQVVNYRSIEEEKKEESISSASSNPFLRRRSIKTPTKSMTVCTWRVSSWEIDVALLRVVAGFQAESTKFLFGGIDSDITTTQTYQTGKAYRKAISIHQCI